MATIIPERRPAWLRVRPPKGENYENLKQLMRSKELHSIIITGAGEKAFAAGADIKEMSDKSPIDMMLGRFEAWEGVRRIRTPMIAAVGGYALGGGCELAMHCERRVR